jgi:hypothetical protein
LDPFSHPDPCLEVDLRWNRDTDDGDALSDHLDTFLAAVPSKAPPIGTESSKGEHVDIPSPSARAIIAP